MGSCRTTYFCHTVLTACTAPAVRGRISGDAISSSITTTKNMALAFSDGLVFGCVLGVEFVAKLFAEPVCNYVAKRRSLDGSISPGDKPVGRPHRCRRARSPVAHSVVQYNGPDGTVSDNQRMSAAPVLAAPDTFTFSSLVDDAPIFVRKWLPPCGIRLRATVQFTHGIAEHSGRYDRLARYLAAEGCAVYALDLRGHGHTAGPTHLGQAA